MLYIFEFLFHIDDDDDDDYCCCFVLYDKMKETLTVVTS